MKLFIDVCCQFTAQVDNTNQGYLGNNENTGYNSNPNNGNNQFTAQVQGYQGNNGNNGRQQIAPPKTNPNGKQQSLQHISIFVLCKLQNE